MKHKESTAPIDDCKTCKYFERWILHVHTDDNEGLAQCTATKRLLDYTPDMENIPPHWCPINNPDSP